MSAKEMLKELGFEIISENEEELTYKCLNNKNDYYDVIIDFHKTEKDYRVYCPNNMNDFDVYSEDAILIDLKLHKAINKQVEELEAKGVEMMTEKEQHLTNIICEALCLIEDPEKEDPTIDDIYNILIKYQDEPPIDVIEDIWG